MIVVTVVTAVAALLIGYVLGRHHERSIQDEKRTIIRRRPHTEKTLEQYPLPEEQEDHSTVVDGQWARPELPNSGVRWS